MSDKFYDFENFETDPEPEANKEQAFGQKYEKTVESANTVQSAKTEQPAEENSYEWNSDNPYRSGEYRYSYINGNNQNAAHNPNNYDDAYSSVRTEATAGSSGYTEQTNPYSSNYTGGMSHDNTRVYNYGTPVQKQDVKPHNTKKKSKPASRGFVAAALAIAVVVAAGAGFGVG